MMRTLLLLCLFGGTLFAGQALKGQVYPHLDAEKERMASVERKRAAEAVARAEAKKKEKELAEEAAKAKGTRSAMTRAEREAMLAKEWKEIETGADTAKNEMQKALIARTSIRDSNVQNMLRAQANLLMGEYRSAEGQFDRVRAKDRTPGNVNHARQGVLTDIRNGYALLGTYQAELLKECTDILTYSQPEILERKKKSLKDDASKYSDRIVDEAKNSAYIQDSLLSRSNEIKGWASDLTARWAALSKALKDAEKFPGSDAVLMRVVECYLHEKTPNVVRARLICELLIKRNEDVFQGRVMNGEAYMKLAATWAAVYDYDKAIEVLRDGEEVCKANAQVVNQMITLQDELRTKERWFKQVVEGN